MGWGKWGVTAEVTGFLLRVMNVLKLMVVMKGNRIFLFIEKLKSSRLP